MTEEDFWSILHTAPDPIPVSYRLYYDDTGSPIIYSMEALSGNYIELEPEIFHQNNMNVRVVNGRLVVKQPVTLVKKLQPAKYGTACDPSDVCIVVDADQPHTKWTIVNNEIN
jgi:hypothetical protein